MMGWRAKDLQKSFVQSILTGWRAEAMETSPAAIRPPPQSSSCIPAHGSFWVFLKRKGGGLKPDIRLPPEKRPATHLPLQDAAFSHNMHYKRGFAAVWQTERRYDRKWVSCMRAEEQNHQFRAQVKRNESKFRDRAGKMQSNMKGGKNHLITSASTWELSEDPLIKEEICLYNVTIHKLNKRSSISGRTAVLM